MTETPTPSLLERLRNLSSGSKSRIIMVASAVAIVGLGSIWAANAKDLLVGINKDSLTPKGTVLSATNRITIESYEQRGDKRYVYFSVKNDTDDILNFSKTDKISLSAKGKTITPLSVTDRQQSGMASRILSQTTAYGTLIFENVTANGGVMTFDGMYFETTPGNQFRESIEIDFQKLKPIQELRS